MGTDVWMCMQVRLLSKRTVSHIFEPRVESSRMKVDT